MHQRTSSLLLLRGRQVLLEERGIENTAFVVEHSEHIHSTIVYITLKQTRLQSTKRHFQKKHSPRCPA